VCRRKKRWSQLHPNVAMLDVLTRACSRAISVQATFSITHAVTHTISFSLSPSHIHSLSLSLSLSLSHTHTHTHTHKHNMQCHGQSWVATRWKMKSQPLVNATDAATLVSQKTIKKILYLSNHVVKNVATTASIVTHFVECYMHTCMTYIIHVYTLNTNTQNMNTQNIEFDIHADRQTCMYTLTDMSCILRPT